jgi:ATP-dependent RNA helicase SUPV3L1/SUV3
VGLNLSIKRIIFHTLLKYDGKVNRILTNTEIKQIAGRAGRYNSIYEEGTVSAVTSHDLNIIRNALNSKDLNITKVKLCALSWSYTN